MSNSFQYHLICAKRNVGGPEFLQARTTQTAGGLREKTHPNVHDALNASFRVPCMTSARFSTAGTYLTSSKGNT